MLYFDCAYYSASLTGQLCCALIYEMWVLSLFLL